MVFKLEIVKNKMDDQFVTELFKLLKERAKINNNSSYTSQLIKNPDLLAKKIGEESSELIIDFIKNNKTGIINESADLLYHLLVIWISMGINPQDMVDVVLHAGASAVLAASIFHFGIFSIPSVKKEMEKNGIQIRDCEK